ncbi:MAG: hypothetical protein ACRECY_04390 [Phyllobacterium sp.]
MAKPTNSIPAATVTANVHNRLMQAKQYVNMAAKSRGNEQKAQGRQVC